MKTNNVPHKPNWQWRGITMLFPLLFLFYSVASAQTDSIEYWKSKYLEEVSTLRCQSNPPVIITNVQMIGLGATNILDTYLSAEKYRGTELRYISLTTRRRGNNPWSRQIIYQGDISYAHNRADNGNEMVGMFNFSYGMNRNWQLLDDRLDLNVGALIDANFGFVYNTRNSNNPAQLKAYINVTPSAATAYHFNIRNQRFTVSYQIFIPFAGLMFSPNYGQSYYEIFSKGNYDHNLVPTTFASCPSMRQMLSLDFSIGKSAIRIGYLGDYQQADINRLKSHIYTHALIIGVVKKFSINKIRP